MKCRFVQVICVVLSQQLVCKIRAQFHGPAYRRIQRLRSRFPAYVLAPNCCASLVSVECLVTRSTHAQKAEAAANPWNRLAVSTEFPASVSADTCPYIRIYEYIQRTVSFVSSIFYAILSCLYLYAICAFGQTVLLCNIPNLHSA